MQYSHKSTGFQQLGIAATDWVKAEPFSEGRAAVDGGVERGGLWGIIDRDGNYVLEPFLNPDSCSREGQRLCRSPLRPFSEGCTSAQHFDEYSRYLFVARDGSFWLYNTLPGKRE